MEIIINGRKVESFEIVRYEMRGNDIEISMIKALDKDGKYIKFVNLKKVLPYLSQFPIRFKKLCNE